MKKATEDQFHELHSLVTEEFLVRVRSGTASTQDLKAACDWLKTNDISGVAYEGSPLEKLANVIPKVDPELIQRRMYGKNIHANL
jgi:TPR repeat protein